MGMARLTRLLLRTIDACMYKMYDGSKDKIEAVRFANKYTYEYRTYRREWERFGIA